MALSKYFARRFAASLKLKPRERENLLRIIELLDASNQVTVGTIQRTLSPMEEPGSATANRSLNRLQDAVDEAAVGTGFKFCITANKRAGIERQVWFEGPTEAPMDQPLPDLEYVRKKAVIRDQRAVPIPNQPVIVAMTFNPNESQALWREFCGSQLPQRVTREGRDYYVLGNHGGTLVVHRTSDQTQGPAQTAAIMAYNDWSPRAIIGVGIAFGAKEASHNLGDVLVSKFIVPYTVTKVTPTQVFQRGEQPSTSGALRGRVRSLVHEHYGDTAWPAIRVGGFLVGNMLIDEQEFRDELIRRSGHDDLVGGDMEGEGLYHAASACGVDWIIIKGISDWARGKNTPDKEKHQREAAANAARVFHAVVEGGGLYDSPMPPAPSPASDGGDDLGPRDPGPYFGADRIDTHDPLPWADHEDPPELDGPAPPGVVCPAPPTLDALTHSYRDGNHPVIDNTRGQETSLRPGEAAPSTTGRGVDVMDHLLEWAQDDNRSQLFALLGESGMGKTVTCQRLAERLSEMQQRDPALRVPLYFDLREVAQGRGVVPSLTDTVQECLNRLSTGRERYTVDNFWDWVERGAVVIFDGLDERLVNMTANDGNLFTRGLLSVIDAQLGDRAVAPKVLVSCRTQYFRTLADQRNHFTGQERGNKRHDSFEAMLLLPFTDEQVRTYLELLGGVDVDSAMQLLRTTHNLTELSHQPMTLGMIGQEIESLERDRLAGKTVTGATLYRKVAERWLGRDGGKHQILPEDKLVLSEHLAAHMWRGGLKGMTARELELWFRKLCRSEEAFEDYTDSPKDLLREDLRTATFVVRRDDDKGSWFRFAHTSMQEYFLASHLFAAARDDHPNHWAMPTPSKETLEFLGQLFDERPEALAAPNRWVTTEGVEVSELLLRYTLHAHLHDHQAPSLRGIRLPGVDLSETVFDGFSLELDLSHADFTGANLRWANFGNVDLRGAGFTAARLFQASFQHCDLTGAILEQAAEPAQHIHNCTQGGTSR